MKVARYRNWMGFRDAYLDDSAQRGGCREDVLFRGQADASWGLRTTLDRVRSFASDEERAAYYETLLREFRSEAIHQVREPFDLPDGPALELLARHHGLPSPLIDWTGSPYIAAFFALSDAARLVPREAIWVLDLTRFDVDDQDVDLIRDSESLRFNRRALRQRGLFTRIRTVRQPTEQLLGDALTKIVLPASLRTGALADLDAMAINSAGLYADLDGAALTAIHRLSGRKEVGDGGSSD